LIASPRVEEKLNFKDKINLVDRVFRFGGLINCILHDEVLSSEGEAFDLNRIFELIAEAESYENNNFTSADIREKVYRAVGLEILNLVDKDQPLMIEDDCEDINERAVKVIVLWIMLNDGKELASSLFTISGMYAQFSYYHTNPEKISKEQYEVFINVLNQAKEVLYTQTDKISAVASLKVEENLVSKVFAYSTLIQEILEKVSFSKEVDQNLLNRIFRLIVNNQTEKRFSLESIREEVYNVVSTKIVNLADKDQPLITDICGSQEVSKFSLEVVLLWIMMNSNKKMI
jgi:hypothetical protein